MIKRAFVCSQSCKRTDHIWWRKHLSRRSGASLVAASSGQRGSGGGEPDEEWGQSVAAYLTLNQPIHFQALLDTLEGQIAHYKFPRRFYHVREMPRTASGKVLKGYC